MVERLQIAVLILCYFAAFWSLAGLIHASIERRRAEKELDRAIEELLKSVRDNSKDGGDGDA